MDVGHDATDNDTTSTPTTLEGRVAFLEKQYFAISQELLLLKKAANKARRKKKPRKQVDKEATSQRLRERLKAFTKFDYARFDNAWLSSFECEDKVVGSAPENTFVGVLYDSIVANGFTPQGCVSARQKKQADGR